MTHEEDDHAGATASVTTLPILYVVVTRDAESGGCTVAGSYAVTSGIIAESFANSIRGLYMVGLEGLGAERTGSQQAHSEQGQEKENQQEQEQETEKEQGSTSLSLERQQQRPVRSRQDIESTFVSALSVWKDDTYRLINTTPHIGDRQAHFKSIRGTSVKVITEQEWEGQSSRLRAGTLLTQFGLGGTTSESTVVGRHPRRDDVVSKFRRWAGW
ncbi:hypothetical protein JCM24511_00065 [Saitozyma sp. JCM 24511]|nr:hypothetical protein JCM24511_00065 [Saitozyma sp. JCM 24511]